MQTPASMVMGIVFAPLGLALVFMAAITPQWREGQAQVVLSGPGVGQRRGAEPVRRGAEPVLLVRSDGLWESCLQMAPPELKYCWPVSGPYQRDPRVRLAQGLTLTSLFFCGTGIVLACIGLRCWKDFPLRGVAATGGLLMVLAGLLSLTALSVYTHHLGGLGLRERRPDSPRASPLSLGPARSLYFGWLGSGLQLAGGVALVLSFKRPRCSTCPAGLAPCPVCSCPEVQDSTEVYEVNC